MKKLLALLLAVVMCLSLVACGGGETPNTDDNEGTEQGEQLGDESTESETKHETFDDVESTTTDGSNTEETPFVVSYEDRDWFNLIKFKTDVEIIELTVENWKDYIKVCSYDRCLLGAGKERYHCFEDVIMELKNKETGEVTTFEFGYNGYSVANDFSLGAYECTKIEGYLYYLNFPEEALAPYEFINLAYIEENGDVSPQPSTLKLDPETNAVEVGGSMEEVLSWCNFLWPDET